MARTSRPTSAAGRRSPHAIPILFACVPLVFAALIVFWRSSPPPVELHLHNPIPYRSLEDIENLPRSPSITYHPNASEHTLLSFVNPSNVAPELPPDTTVVILNWSRFPNVLRITSLLCAPILQTVVKEILVWNNNPKPLFYYDFVDTTCTPSQLKVHNSPENSYFHARFLGCAQATTTYCYTQDDDYIVLPEIIWTLRSRMAEYVTPSTIHLLPPHEHLSTDLRAIRNNGDLHVSFAWLGHGAIMHQSRAVEFLDLLQHLNATDSEFKMADNYFSLLSNIIPEVWFDQGIELGGGQAFTVGVEGDVRNKFHILQAAHYLDSLLACEDYPCDTRKKPFLHNKRSSPSSTLVDVQRAPCAGRPCLLETRMKVLPSTIVHHGEHAAEILDLEEDQRANYLGRPPSFAVDGRPATAFVSLEDAKAEDYIMLDMLTDVGHAWSDLTLVWLVPPSTQVVLSQCVFEMSLDGHAWAKSQDSLSCTEAVPIFDDAEQPLELTECSVKMNANSSAASVRFLKAYLPQDVAQRWAVHEIWVRGIRK